MPTQAADESLFDPRTKLLAVVFFVYGLGGQIANIFGLAPALDATQLTFFEFAFWYGATNPVTTALYFVVAYFAISLFPTGQGRRYQI